MCWKVSPLDRYPESKNVPVRAPVSRLPEVTVWTSTSLFVHITVVPLLISITAGL